MRKILGVALLLTVSGCTTTKRVWNKDGGTKATFRTDRYECMKDARVYNSDSVTRGRYTSTQAEIATDDKFFVECMLAKGWAPKFVEVSESLFAQ